MKKLKSFLTLALTFGFLASVALTSCGGKKEETATETEQTEAEHPAEGREHPSEGGEHPAADTSSDTTAAQ